MKILSCDPGKYGALAISDYSKGLPFAPIQMFKMPLLKNGKDYDIRAVKEIFDMDYDFVIMEDVHSVFGSSAKSNFVFGFGVGMLRGMAEITNRPYILTNPKAWQKVAWEGISKVKDPKLNSQAAAHRLFPHINFVPTARSTNVHDGFIDAALIGYYGFVKHSQK